MRQLPWPPRLLLVRPEEALVEKALRAELAVWVVTEPHRHPSDWLQDVRRRPGLTLVEVGDTDTMQALVIDTMRHNAVTYVLPAWYGGIGQRSARILSDPVATRELTDAGNGHIAPLRSAASVADVVALVRELGFPSVVSSGANRAVLHSEDDLRRWARTDQCSPWLAAPLPDGIHLVVSTLTLDGMHHVAGITERTPAGDHLHPDRLSASDRAVVAATVTNLLDLADHEFGPAETDVVLTALGPRLVASGARFAEPPVADLISLASGFDPVTALLHMLVGRPPAVPSTSHGCAVGGPLWLPPGGQIPPSGLHLLAALPGVARVSCEAAAVGSTQEAIGSVLVTGLSPEQVIEWLHAVRQTVAAWR
jgi:hypothetical protein